MIDWEKFYFILHITQPKKWLSAFNDNSRYFQKGNSCNKSHHISKCLVYQSLPNLSSKLKQFEIILGLLWLSWWDYSIRILQCIQFGVKVNASNKIQCNPPPFLIHHWGLYNSLRVHFDKKKSSQFMNITNHSLGVTQGLFKTSWSRKHHFIFLWHCVGNVIWIEEKYDIKNTFARFY